jgi:glycosyltransferase involved in cell wall biosynthesis
MKLAILHYHLNRGGVTQVILNHLKSLNAVAADDPLQVLVLYGGRHAAWPHDVGEHLAGVKVSLRAIPELEYDEAATDDPRPETVARRVCEELNRLGFPPAETVMHVHNHGLGKNLSLPGALPQIVENGYALLLQIHDFAEDFRPANYRRLVRGIAARDSRRLPSRLYPQNPRVHYAVLNGRDAGVLEAAGLAPDRLHALPNPVADFGSLPDRSEARVRLARFFPELTTGHLMLYPVRGIRRKNVGEMLLWAASAEEADVFALTLPPLNPLERPAYERWTALSDELNLPCRFGLGALEGVQFTDNLAAADAVMTTSIAEGFGMVFLESWLAQRPLFGRDLPEITADFTAAGIDLDALYRALWVPLDWIGEAVLRDSLRSIFQNVQQAFASEHTAADDFEREFAMLTDRGCVDFAILPSSLQAQVIRRVHRDAEARRGLIATNPFLGSAMNCLPDAARVQRNAEAVRREFSLRACGQRLLRIYRSLLDQPNSADFEPPPHGERILASFLQLKRLQPIRVES